VPPVTAAKTLQGYISELRRLLQPGVAPDHSAIATQPPGYLLQLPAEAVDLAQFERLWRVGRQALSENDPARAQQLLESALGLWRGEPLADIATQGEISLEVGRLHELRLACMEDRFAANLDAGGGAALVPELERLVAANPLRERLCRQLMLALYRGGRQADALGVARGLRERLLELGISPSPETAELEQAILNHEQALRTQPPSGPVSAVERRTLLVACQAGSDLQSLSDLATLIAATEADRDLTFVQVVDPRGRLAYGEQLRTVTQRLSEHRRLLAGRGIDARVAAFASAQAGADVIRLAEHQQADLLVVNGTAELLAGRSGLADRLLADAPCDVAVHLPRPSRSHGDTVLVPFGGNEHDWAALELAVQIARHEHAPLMVAGAAHSEDADASRLLADASLVVQRAYGVVAEPAIVAPGPSELLDLAAQARIVVAGLSPRYRARGLGETRQRIAARAPCDVVFVRRGVSPGLLAPGWTATSFGWSLPSGVAVR